jgi:hypothetical protein
MRWIVGKDNFDSSANLRWPIPSIARAARSWAEVIIRFCIHASKMIFCFYNVLNDVSTIIFETFGKMKRALAARQV